MKDDILIDVSRETIALLQRLGLLVEKWNKSINLISKKTVPEIWDRHILDSAQIFYASNKNFKKWLDMGSGAGFPGLVVAILAKDKNIDGEIVLVESDKRKCVFLSTVKREFNLNLSIIVAESHTGAIKAYIGSQNYYDFMNHGAVDYSRAIRSPGSTLKPFIYALAQANGNIAFETIIDDRAIDLKGYQPKNMTNKASVMETCP